MNKKNYKVDKNKKEIINGYIDYNQIDGFNIKIANEIINYLNFK